MRWCKGSGVVLFSAVAVVACNPTQLPGDEEMGKVAFHAEPYEVTCELAELSRAPFDFEATLTHNKGTDEAWVTLNGFSRPATFDGQVLTSVQSATRFFQQCEACSQLVVEETLVMSLLSKSQTDAAGGDCPANPLDGGVAVPTGEGGITAPGTTSVGGFDMLRACGEVIDVVKAGPDAGEDPHCTACVGCQMRSVLKGARQ
ncbi:MAG: hypothetical protein K1X64_07260 [Myxococcaceae bacterium]|nr:hypothetical protein [Myxococcaceae bacterium]